MLLVCCYRSAGQQLYKKYAILLPFLDCGKEDNHREKIDTFDTFQ